MFTNGKSYFLAEEVNIENSVFRGVNSVIFNVCKMRSIAAFSEKKHFC